MVWMMQPNPATDPGASVSGASGALEAYHKFIESKIRMAALNGVPCEQSEINPILFPHQRDIVQWAVMGGQR